MMQFLRRYSHWILLVLVFMGLASSFISGRYDGPSLVFGVLGAVGVGYLVYRIEADKKSGKKE